MQPLLVWMGAFLKRLKVVYMSTRTAITDGHDSLNQDGLLLLLLSLSLLMLLLLLLPMPRCCSCIGMRTRSHWWRL